MGEEMATPKIFDVSFFFSYLTFLWRHDHAL